MEALLGEQVTMKQKAVETSEKSMALTVDQRRAMLGAAAALEEMTEQLSQDPPADNASAFMMLKKAYDARTKAIKTDAEQAGKKLSNVFAFCEEVFGDGQEILIFVTELTVGYHSARFISRYGCKEYFDHNKELLFFERQKEIIREMELLDWEE